MQSLASRLLDDLDEVMSLLEELLDATTIDWVPNRGARFARETGVVVMGMSDGVWGPLDDTQRRLQRQILERWQPWNELLDLLFAKDTRDARNEVQQAKKSVLAWIERSVTWGLPRTIPEAKTKVQEAARPLRQALERLTSADGQLVIVPDTNVLLGSPELPSYGSSFGEAKYMVVLVPSVLRELDEHKVNHRNPDVREKAQKFAKRIKGWRNQGDLARGVRVQGDVFVRVEGREPDFASTLSWLQRDIEDDRILASILELQRTAPSDRVVLITGDTVMLAKADAARVPTVDEPDTES